MKTEFSKLLLIQESILIWLITLSGIVLAFYCTSQGYLASLPWLSTLVGLPWSAYGVSQAFYYNKAKAENTANGIKYESALRSSYAESADEPLMDYYVSDDYQI